MRARFFAKRWVNLACGKGVENWQSRPESKFGRGNGLYREIVIVSVFVFKRLRFSYGIYMLLTLFVALSTGTFMSIGRYISVLFPIYILMASVKNNNLKQIYLFSSILLLAVYTALFVNNYWAG